MDSVGSSVMNRRLGIGREGGIGGRSAQQVEAHLERLIDRLIGGLPPTDKTVAVVR